MKPESRKIDVLIPLNESMREEEIPSQKPKSEEFAIFLGGIPIDERKMFYPPVCF